VKDPKLDWNALNEGEIHSVHYTFEINNQKMYLLPLECGRTLPLEWGELVSTSGMWRTDYRQF
jgi:hypothetical protein